MRLGERAVDARMHGLQHPDRGEETKPAATGAEEQLAIGRSQALDIAARDVAHHKDARLARPVERRAEQRARRRLGQMMRADAHFRRAPVETFFTVSGIAQRRGCDQHAMRRFQHGFGERNGRIDPVALQPDIEVASIVTLDLEPIGELGCGVLLVFERREHRAPRRNEQTRTPLDAARRRFEPHGADVSSSSAASRLSRPRSAPATRMSGPISRANP